MTSKRPLSEILNDIDKEFGHSTSYWFSLLCISMHNKEAAEILIQRIIDYKKDEK